MAAVIGVNSYVDVNEADTYFSVRFGYPLWEPSAEKEKALVSAAQILDSQCDWYGEVVDQAQPLAFPREPDFSPVPDDIKDAQCEIAYNIIATGSTSQKGDDPLVELKAGTVSMKFEVGYSGNPLLNALIDSLLVRYGMYSGSGSTTLIQIGRQ